jgi:putative inorganic carbon (HCO3(-)) transporter
VGTLGEWTGVARSVIAGESVDRRAIKGSLLALLIAGEIVLGYVIAVRPQNPYLILGAATGLIVVAVTFVEPVLGLYLFVVAAFTEASWMFGSVSAARLLGILTLAAWIARSVASGRFEIVMPGHAWFAAMFASWGLMSALWAMDTQRLLAALLLLVQLMALYILVINLVNSVKRVQIILAIITVVSLALALLTISRVVSGELVDGRVDLGHISVADMNTQAAYFLPSATVFMVFFSHKAQLAQKLLLLLGLSVIALAILATSSRGAMVSLVAILVLGMIIDHKLWQVALPALLVGGVAMLFLPHTFVERLQTLVTLSDRGNGRVDIWLVALRIIRSHPVLGVGLDSFGRAFDRYVAETPGIIRDIGRGRGSHNTFLNVQSELGVIGTLLFLVFLGMTLKSGLLAVSNWRRAGSPHMAALALAAWLSLAGMLVVGVFLDLQYWKLFWLLLALPEVMRRLSVESVQETACG